MMRFTPAALAVTTLIMRGRFHRINAFTARNVAPDAVHRNVLVPQDDAGNCFHFHVLQRGPLLQRKVADLLLREAEMSSTTCGGSARMQSGNFAIGQAERCGRPVVEFFGVLAYGSLSAAGDIREDRLHGFANLRAVLGLRFRGLAVLDVRTDGRHAPDTFGPSML